MNNDVPNIKNLLVSHHDSVVHLIRKYKMVKKVQLEMIVQIGEAENGIVASYQVYKEIRCIAVYLAKK